MKSYINLFLTLVMPLSILFTAISIVYHAMDFAFSKAIKLGIVTGILSGILLAVLLAIVILLARKIQANKIKIPINSFSNASKPSPALKEHEDIFEINSAKKPTLEKKFILLMDKELAYETSLQSMKKQNIGEIIYQNKNKGLILLKDDLKELKMNITMLTRHTAEIRVTGTLAHHLIKNIMTAIKTKEYLFLKY